MSERFTCFLLLETERFKMTENIRETIQNIIAKTFDGDKFLAENVENFLAKFPEWVSGINLAEESVIFPGMSLRDELADDLWVFGMMFRAA